MRVLLGIVALALIAAPASGALINGGFEADLAGWACTNVMINPSSYVPNPATLEGVKRAGDSNCNARNSLGSQMAMCDPVIPDGECHLTGGLAGGDAGGYQYFVRLIGAGGTDQIVLGPGVNNWVMFDLVVYDSCEEVTVEFGSTGAGAWGAVGYHVDALELVCIPEPASLALLCLAGLPLLRRRR